MNYQSLSKISHNPFIANTSQLKPHIHTAHPNSPNLPIHHLRTFQTNTPKSLPTSSFNQTRISTRQIPPNGQDTFPLTSVKHSSPKASRSPELSPQILFHFAREVRARKISKFCSPFHATGNIHRASLHV